MTQPLATGTALPELPAKDLDGNDVDVTATVAGHWAFIQLYRGHW